MYSEFLLNISFVSSMEIWLGFAKELELKCLKPKTVQTHVFLNQHC